MSWDPNQNESDTESDNEDTRNLESGKFAFVLLVDAFLSESDNITECLNLIKELLLYGVIIRPKDLVGIVFYNTDHSPTPKITDGMDNIVVHKNTAVFLPLWQLSKGSVKHYLDFCDNGHNEFKSIYGCKQGDFSEAIWLCTNMLQRSGIKTSSARIIVFTNKETPHECCSPEYQKALRKANDLKEIEVQFAVAPMKQDFNFNSFYKEFICTVHDYDLDAINDEDLYQVQETLLHPNRCHRKQSTAHLLWALGEGLDISVNLYNYYTDSVYPKRVMLTREDNAVVDVKHVQKVILPDGTEQNCLPGSSKPVIFVGGEKFTFSPEELNILKHPLPPGIRLLGFKSRKLIAEHDFVKSGAFLYPNDEHIAGSAKLFRALWEQCILKCKVAFCVLTQKRNSSPRYVALLPSQKDRKGESHTWTNDGFHVLYIPFQNEYRPIDISDRLPIENEIDKEDEAVKILEDGIKQLKINYNPFLFKDPTLKMLLAKIISVAFDMEMRDLPGADNFFIDQEKLNEIMESVSSRVKPLLENSKRGAADEDGDDSVSAKKKKSDTVTEEEIKDHLRKDTLNKLTVKQLRNYIQQNNINNMSKASKSALISKVKELHSI